MKYILTNGRYIMVRDLHIRDCGIKPSVWVTFLICLTDPTVVWLNEPNGDIQLQLTKDFFIRVLKTYRNAVAVVRNVKSNYVS